MIAVSSEIRIVMFIVKEQLMIEVFSEVKNCHVHCPCSILYLFHSTFISKIDISVQA